MKRDDKAATLAVVVLVSVLTQLGWQWFVTSAPAFASRNASGTYSLPTGNPVVTGTAISSTVHNNTMSDIGTEITDSLNRSGKGAMLAPLKLYVGATPATPDLTFSTDNSTGVYLASAGVVAFSSAGTKKGQFGAGGLVIGTSTSTADAMSYSYGLTASIDFAGTTDSCETSAQTLTGAATGATCLVSTTTLPSANSWVTCTVTAADTVTVKHCSHGASGNPAATNYYIRVFE